jgi:uncharacterized membrane protein
LNPQTFFTGPDREKIREAIAASEKLTSGEIRIHLESSSKVNAFERATQLFAQLNMHNTADRNGVLIYLALDNREFAILADKGINEKVPEGFWDMVVKEMSDFFKSGQFADGLIHGVKQAGEKLAAYFPYNALSDTNELSDDISFGE